MEEMIKVLKEMKEKLDKNELIKTFDEKELNELKGKVENILTDKASCFIGVSNVGIISMGRGIELLALLSIIVENLKKNGMADEIIKSAVDEGLKTNTEDKINEMLDKILKEISGE